MATEIIDAHVHVACDPESFPRRLAPFGSSNWWETTGASADLVRALDGSGIERAVIVQAVALYGYDCRCARSVAHELGARFAFVGAIDVASRDPVRELDRLRAEGHLAGVRLFGVAGAEQTWLTDGRGATIFAWAAARGQTLVATLFASDLGPLGELAASHPAVPVALDHCGFPDLARDEGPLRALAAVPSITLKVSSHNLDRPEAADFVERLAATFGTARLAWGSDFPQHHTRTYAECLDLAIRATVSFSDADRTQFFATTATRVWFS